MAEIQGLRLSQEEVSQTIDLDELFDGFNGSESLKAEIGQAIVDRIVDRTESGKGNNGKNLKRPYSESYSNSADFERFGKSPSRVNMTLRGNMLDSIDAEVQGNSIVVAVGDGEAPKSFNHMTGDTVPKRPFFGVNKRELNEIKRQFKDRLEETETRSSALDLLTLRELADPGRDSAALLATLFDRLTRNG